MAEEQDIVIIGGGPAGLTAGLYASRAGLKTLLIEEKVLGGQIINAELVENYPGFPAGLGGYELAEAMTQQTMKYGLKVVAARVTGLENQGKYKVVKSTEGDYMSKAVIIAGGSERRKLGVPGEERLVGRGVSYCATCDAAFFKDQRVAVAGGGDAAITEALFLTRFASRVIVIHRRSQLRASWILQKRAFDNPKIEFLWDTVIDEILGPDQVKGLRLRKMGSGELSTLEVDGVFITIGFDPNTAYLAGILSLDNEGHIVTNELMETKIPGIFAAGDIRHHSARQVVTAAGDGATAALSAERYISGLG